MVDHIGEGTKFGRYALLDKIGTGGMAEIYRAKTFGAAGFEKEFAIKLILPSLVDDSEFVEMFINEAKIAVSLYHANIVQVFDLGELEGQYYIAMEYVLGKDLLEILARCAERGLKIPLNLVLFITMEMLKGLNFAHRAKDPFGEDLNIIHRDVSPSNIMISYAGDVKVGDFGVAKAAIERTLTESGTLKGKVGYMSPEQVMGEEIDARSDIFAAGVVFFEALSMSRLFVGGSDLEVMLQVRDADIKDSMNKAEPLPDGLREIVRKALTKHPQERFQSSGEFYQALVDFCYQHSIKVTGTDLSNFMRRLFADEIEEEKTKRRAEPRLKEIVGDPDANSSESINHRPTPVAQEDARQMPLSEASESARSQPAPTGGKRYRYRDASGLIYGPMTMSAVIDLLSEHSGDDVGTVSLDGDPWQDPHEVPPLRGELAQTQPDDPDETVDASAEPADPVAGADTVRASAPEPSEAEDVGDESTTLPEESDLARELEAAVSSLEQIGRDAANSPASGAGPEPSSDVYDEPAVSAEDPAESAGTSKAIAQLKSQYASYEGDLSRVPFARILARLHRSGATGRLFVQRDGIEKSIFLRDGEPILVSSNNKDELLGSFLLRKEKISQAQLDEALDRLSEWGGRLGDALVAIGAIQAHGIFELLAEQMREKLIDVFTWTDGHYGYYENQEPDTMGYPLGIDTYSTIVSACREHIPLELIDDYYDNRDHVPIYHAGTPPIDVDRLKLSTREVRILTQLEAGTTLHGLLEEVGQDRSELATRTIYLLHQVEVIEFETTDRYELPGD